MNSLPKALRSYCVSAVFKIRPAFILLIAFAASNLTGGSRIPSAIAGQNTQRATSALPVATEARALAGYRRLPLSFEPNVGQSDSSVDFLSRASGYTLFLSGGEAVLSLQGQTRKKSPELVPDLVKSNHPQKAHSATVLRMQLLGSDAKASVRGMQQLPGRSNYIHGNNPKDWHTNVAAYARVQYNDVYPGVNLVYYGNQGQLEYDFSVSAGADPHQIAMQFAGARHLHIDVATGDLVMNAGREEVRFHKPLAYQAANADSSASEKNLVAASYVVDARNRVTFQLGSYDRSKSLVIDPALSYSTYLGGSADDFATSLAVDAGGSVYITGYTSSANFPVSSGALQTTCKGGCSGTSDAFLTKLDPTGTSIVYSTYLGGSGNDYSNSVALDAFGNAYLAGQTLSSDFPVTAGALQSTCGAGNCAGGDAFVAELNSTGSALIYSTYFGGSSVDQANSIVLDSSNNAFITGYTQSTDFPVTLGAFQSSCSCSTHPDAYVAELNSTGSALVYSTYLGGSTAADVAYAVVLDSNNDAFVAGYTQSSNFPTTSGAYQTALGATSAGFVTKLNPTGTALIYSTYLGGNNNLTTPCEACITSITIDSAGDAYVAGLTAEANFPTTAGAFQRTFKSTDKGHDAFITELNPTGSGVIFSTYLGGAGDDGATGIAVDASANVWLKGNTKSTDFPVSNGAFQTKSGGDFDHYVAELNPTGTQLLFSTYLGGSGIEFGGATKMLAIDSQSPPNIYAIGYTNSTNFPTTPGAFQTAVGGGNDAVISKLVPSPNVGLSPTNVSFGTQLVGSTSPSHNVTVTNTGNLDLPAPTITLTGVNKADFSQNSNCSGTIAPQAACTIFVTFTPTLFAVENASLVLTDSAPNSPQTIALTGTGIHAGAAMTVTPASLTFTKTVLKTASPAKVITLTNTGTEVITISALTITGDFSQTNNCSSLALNATCTINVTFTPTAINNRTGKVTITDSAPTSPQTVSLMGTGSEVQLSAATLNFGNVMVGRSVKQSFTLKNVGTTAMSLTKVAISGAAAQDYTQTNNCGTTVAAAATCTFTVTFKPTAKGGRIASISMTDTGGGSPQSVALNGQGQQQ